MFANARPKKPVNLSLSEDLVSEAKHLGVNLSQAAEEGVRRAAMEAWIREHAAAVEANNKWVERNGLPLEKRRLF